MAILEDCCMAFENVRVSKLWPMGLLFDLVFVVGVKYEVKILFPLNNV